MTSGLQTPLVTVVIPTYRRLHRLQRAVGSVLRQTYPHWELIISDDEGEEGETWAYISDLAEQDDRVRVFKNAGPHGQVGNTNNALAQAQGEWIKLLHDDDLLKHDCLRELVGIAGVRENIACITCGVDRYENGHVRSSQWRSGWPLLEVIPQDDILLAMYLIENTGGAMPSQKMIHRRVLDQGVAMEQPPGLRWMVDSWFNVKIAEVGDLVIYRKPLVEWHQDGHETETDALSDREKDQELILFRHLLWEKIRDRFAAPSPALMSQMTYVQQALLRMKRGRWKEGWTLLRHVKEPQAYGRFLHWTLHNLTKGRLSRAGRVKISTALPTSG